MAPPAYSLYTPRPQNQTNHFYEDSLHLRQLVVLIPPKHKPIYNLQCVLAQSTPRRNMSSLRSWPHLGLLFLGTIKFLPYDAPNANII